MGSLMARDKARSGAVLPPPDQRLNGDQRPVAEFWCIGGCGNRERGQYMPQGWFSVMQHSGTRQPAHRVGCFCSAACLESWAAKVADSGAVGADYGGHA